MNKTLILVVEDDAPLQRMMSAFLGLNGFSVVGAANGEEALNTDLQPFWKLRPTIRILFFWIWGFLIWKG